MSNAVYTKIELVGTSKTSIEEAIGTAVASAGASDKADWFEVQEIRGAIKDGQVTQYQVVLKVGCRVN